jgi:hypothetical protein
MGLRTGFSTIYISGIPGTHDVQTRVQFTTEQQTSEANSEPIVAEFRPGTAEGVGVRRAEPAAAVFATYRDAALFSDAVINATPLDAPPAGWGRTSATSGECTACGRSSSTP